MDRRFHDVCIEAAEQFGVASIELLDRLGVSPSQRHRWVRSGLLEKLGPRSFRIAGAPITWPQQLAAGLADLRVGLVAGRSGAALYGLDGFDTGAVEFLVSYEARHRTTRGLVVATRGPVGGDVRHVDGLRTVAPERLIVDAPRFGFDRSEIENAIDSAIRLRLVSEPRLRARVLREHSAAINGSRLLVDALVDTGGESTLERAFLRLIRRFGLPLPELQVVHRDGGRQIARVDALFGDDLVVEVSGHRTHSTRQQLRSDEQRRTELTLQGRRVITFTRDDVVDRPEWVAARLRDATHAPKLAPGANERDCGQAGRWIETA